MQNFKSIRQSRIEGLIEEPFVQNVTGTTPPKVLEMKWWLEPEILKDHYISPISPICMSFVFNKKDALERTPAKQYHIEIQNIDTGEKKYFLMDADKKPYNLWEKYQEAYTNLANDDGNPIELEEIPNSKINARLIITPLNTYGSGKNSIFIIPSKNLYSINIFMINDYPTNVILLNNWHYFMPEPNNERIQPKYMFIYLNQDKAEIEKDADDFLDNKWITTTPYKNWEEINLKTYRWLINNNNEYHKYNKDVGWKSLELEEINFIDDIMKSFKDIYRQFLTDNSLEFNDPHIFKLCIPNPKDEKDSIIIYVIKGTRWQI
jgi:hypothetical protein